MPRRFAFAERSPHATGHRHGLLQVSSLAPFTQIALAGLLGLTGGQACTPDAPTEAKSRASSPGATPDSPSDGNPTEPSGPNAPATAAVTGNARVDDGSPPPVRQDGTVFAESALMGTQFSVNVWLADHGRAAAAGAAIRDAFTEMARIETIASEWQADSDLSRLNRAAGGPPVDVPIELIDILERSATISQATHGKFDVTFYAVGSLWRFGPDARPPDATAIAARLPLVDHTGVQVDRANRTVRITRPGAMIGLGAIAKGYAVDKASRLLHGRGFHDHIVEGGGDTYVSGTKGGTPWQVGIKDPATGGTLAALPVRDRAVVTSGTYERYFEHDGVTYTHILDPTTGWPIPKATSPVSVTIVAADTTDADAYATAVMVMGSQAGLRFIEDSPRLEGAIITATGELLVTTGLRNELRTRAGVASAEPGR